MAGYDGPDLAFYAPIVLCGVGLAIDLAAGRFRNRRLVHFTGRALFFGTMTFGAFVSIAGTPLIASGVFLLFGAIGLGVAVASFFLNNSQPAPIAETRGS